jgi:hypothetical protein
MDHSHSYSLEMPLAREAAWQRLRDLSVAHHYVPGLTGTEIRTAQREGVGASRRVFQSGGKWLDETVTSWTEGQGFEIRLHRGEEGMVAPFREATFRYWLEDAGVSSTRLVLTLSYTLRWGVFGALLERLAMGRGVTGNLRDVALGLRDYYLSGTPVTDARRAELRRAQ